MFPDLYAMSHSSLRVSVSPDHPINTSWMTHGPEESRDLYVSTGGRKDLEYQITTFVLTSLMSLSTH